MQQRVNLLIKMQTIFIMVMHNFMMSILYTVIFNTYGKRMDGVKTDYSSQKWCELDEVGFDVRPLRIVTHIISNVAGCTMLFIRSVYIQTHLNQCHW